MKSNRMLPFLAFIAAVVIGSEIEAADPPDSLGSPRWNVIDHSESTMIKKLAALDRPITLFDCLAARLGRPLTDKEKAVIVAAGREVGWGSNAGGKAYRSFVTRVRKIQPNMKPKDVVLAIWPDAPCFESYLVPGWEIVMGGVTGQLTESMTKYVLQEERRFQTEMQPLAYAWTRTISDATGLSMRDVVEARRMEEKILRERILAGIREQKTKSAK